MLGKNIHKTTISLSDNENSDEVSKLPSSEFYGDRQL